MQAVAHSQRQLPPAAFFSCRRSYRPVPPFCARPLLQVITCSLRSPSDTTNEAKFIEKAKSGNLIPLHKCIFSDHLTPVLAYRCLVGEDDRETPSFLFESIEPGSRTSTVGRYSVVGADPAMEIVAKEKKVTILDHEAGKMTEVVVEDPMTVARSISEEWNPRLISDLPDSFCE